MYESLKSFRMFSLCHLPVAIWTITILKKKYFKMLNQRYVTFFKEKHYFILYFQCYVYAML